jgi:hypothetical protein
MELTQSIIEAYADTIFRDSKHKYIATAAECAATARRVGRPVAKMVNVAFQAPFKTKNTLSMIRTTYDDGDTETIIVYDNDLVCRYGKSSYISEFDVCKTYESDWQVDLTVLYQVTKSGL